MKNSFGRICDLFFDDNIGWFVLDNDKRQIINRGNAGGVNLTVAGREPWLPLLQEHRWRLLRNLVRA